jgi:hypothetical protein
MESMDLGSTKIGKVGKISVRIRNYSHSKFRRTTHLYLASLTNRDAIKHACRLRCYQMHRLADVGSHGGPCSI